MKITKKLFTQFLYDNYKGAKCALIYNNDFELLISIILSAQTTDEAVNKVTPTLFKTYPNIKALALAQFDDVSEIIKRIGIYKNKAKNIIECANKLNSLGYDFIPNNKEMLLSLPGVGYKTASVFLSEYYDTNDLGVDTHIERISKRLALAKCDDNPKEISIKLSKFFKDEHIKDIHHMLLSFGRDICLSRNPKCECCNLRDYCIYKGQKSVEK